MSGVSTSNISQIERDTVQTAVTNQLRRLILTQDIKPGERLVQDELAQKLGVSRTPVREAIRQLETEKLVTIMPYKGAIVSTVSAEELKGLYEIRIALQTHASRLAMEKLKKEDVATLKKFVSNMQKAFQDGEPEQLLEANYQFSITFYKLAKEPPLFNLIMHYLEQSRRFRQQHFYDSELAQRTIEAHQALLELIAAGNTEAVVAQMHQELKRIASELIEPLEKGQA